MTKLIVEQPRLHRVCQKIVQIVGQAAAPQSISYSDYSVAVSARSYIYLRPPRSLTSQKSFVATNKRGSRIPLIQLLLVNV